MRLLTPKVDAALTLVTGLDARERERDGWEDDYTSSGRLEYELTNFVESVLSVYESHLCFRMYLTVILSTVKIWSLRPTANTVKLMKRANFLWRPQVAAVNLV